METGIVVFFNNDSRSFFIDEATSLKGLKAHILDSFSLDKSSDLELKTIDDSLVITSEDDLQTLREQIGEDDYAILMASVLESKPLPPSPLVPEVSPSLFAVHEEPKKEEVPEKKSERLEIPEFFQKVLRQMEVDPEETRSVGEQAFSEISSLFPGLFPSSSVNHLNAFLNRLSSDLEKHEDEINELASSLKRPETSSSSSSSSSSSTPAPAPHAAPAFPFGGAFPFFMPFVPPHVEVTRRCPKDFAPCIRIRVERPEPVEPIAPKAPVAPQVHHATCDNCSTLIEGARYKCIVCPDFDLCSKCESSNVSHNPDHLFVKMKRPVDAINFNLHQKQRSHPAPSPVPSPCHPAHGRRGQCVRGDREVPVFFGRFPGGHPEVVRSSVPVPPPAPQFVRPEAPPAGPHGWRNERKNLHERIDRLESLLASLETKLDRL